MKTITKSTVIAAAVLLCLCGVLIAAFMPVRVRLSMRPEPVALTSPLMAFLQAANSGRTLEEISQEFSWHGSLRGNIPMFGNAMDIAIMENRLDIVVWLLDQGMDPDTTLASEYYKTLTPIQYAAMYDSAELAAILLKYGADPLFVGPFGKSALEIAEEEGNDDIGQLFEDASPGAKE